MNNMNFVVFLLLCFQAQRHALNGVVFYNATLGPWPDPPNHQGDGTYRWPMNGTCHCRDCDRNKYEYGSDDPDDYENVAFGKPSDGTKNEATPSCAVNNGFKESDQSTFNVGDKLVCYFSDTVTSPTPAWLMVDLQSVFTFQTVGLHHLHEEHLGLQGISNTSVFVDGTLAHTFEDITYEHLNVIISPTFAKEVVGRYVLLQKLEPKSSLLVCELRIFVCKQEYWGKYAMSEACRSCNTNCDYPCNNYFGCRNVYHDVAINKPAVKRENDPGDQDRNGSTINDYFPSTEYTRTCMRMTTREQGKTLWWRVDMQGLHAVNHVLILSLDTQHATDYLNDFSVAVTYDTQLPESPDNDQLCATGKSVVGRNKEGKVPCVRNLYGRYLWVTAKEKLGMCKVRVLGRPIYLLRPGSTCRPTSQYIFCGDGDCVNDRCVIRFLKTCSNNGDCMGDLVCHHRLCKSELRKECRIDDHCVDDLVCDQKKCRQRAGAQCTDSNAEASCSTGAVCQDNVCKLILDQTCADNTTLCVSGTTCSDGKCKIVQGGYCQNEPTLCETGLCSAHDNHTCRIDVNKSCSSETARFCRKGSVCEHDNVCKLKFGEDCQSTSQCQHGFQCSSRQPSSQAKKCMKSAGQDCSQNNTGVTQCAAGLICDPAHNTCRIQIGEHCENEMKNYCVNGSVCGYESVCTRSDPQRNCSGTDNVTCKAGTVCDFLGKCRVAVGEPCSVNSMEARCVAGAQCVQSRCDCDNSTSIPSGAICRPNPGKYGSSCAVERCTEENTRCVNRVCLCKPGADPQPDFTCVRTAPTSASSDWGGFAIGGTAGAVLLLVVLGAVIPWFVNIKKDAKHAAQQEPRAPLSSLQAVESLPEDDRTSECSTEQDPQEPPTSIDSTEQGPQEPSTSIDSTAEQNLQDPSTSMDSTAEQNLQDPSTSMDSTAEQNVQGPSTSMDSTAEQNVQGPSTSMESTSDQGSDFTEYTLPLGDAPTMSTPYEGPAVTNASTAVRPTAAAVGASTAVRPTAAAVGASAPTVPSSPAASRPITFQTTGVVGSSNVTMGDKKG